MAKEQLLVVVKGRRNPDPVLMDAGLARILGARGKVTIIDPENPENPEIKARRKAVIERAPETGPVERVVKDGDSEPEERGSESPEKKPRAKPGQLKLKSQQPEPELSFPGDEAAAAADAKADDPVSGSTSPEPDEEPDEPEELPIGKVAKRRADPVERPARRRTTTAPPPTPRRKA